MPPNVRLARRVVEDNAGALHVVMADANDRQARFVVGEGTPPAGRVISSCRGGIDFGRTAMLKSLGREGVVVTS